MMIDKDSIFHTSTRTVMDEDIFSTYSITPNIITTRIYVAEIYSDDFMNPSTYQKFTKNILNYDFYGRWWHYRSAGGIRPRFGKTIKRIIIVTKRILFIRMPDSRSGFKGRTIRKRMGKFYQ